MSLPNFSEFFSLQLIIFEAVRNLMAIVGCVVTVRAGSRWLIRQARHNTLNTVTVIVIIGVVYYLSTSDAFGATAAPQHTQHAPAFNAALLICVLICAVVTIISRGGALPVIGIIAGCVGILYLIYECLADVVAWLDGLFPAPETSATIINAETLRTAVESQARITEALIQAQADHAALINVIIGGGVIISLIALWLIAIMWIDRRFGDSVRPGQMSERVVYVQMDQAGRVAPVDRQLTEGRAVSVVEGVRHDR